MCKCFHDSGADSNSNSRVGDQCSLWVVNCETLALLFRTLRMKDWERVNRVTRTPLSARKEAISTTPMLQHTLQPTPQPILKSPARKEGVSQATREVTAERPKRLQFAQVLSAVKPIPSRAQG